MDNTIVSKPQFNIITLNLIIVLSLVPLFEAGFDNEIVNYMLVLSFLSLGLFNLKSTLKISYNSPLFYITLYLIWCTLSFIWSVHYVRTLIELLQLSLYIVVFYMASKIDNVERNKVITIVLLMGSCIGLLGILEYIFVESGRIVSTFTNPNPFGTYLLMLFLFSLGLILRKKNIALVLSSYILLISLLLTGSRGSFLSFFFALPFLFIGFKGKDLFKAIIYTIIFIILGLAGARLIMYISPIVQDNLGLKIDILNSLIRKDSLVGTSFVGRIEFWKAAIRIFLSKPITGYGLGSFFSTYYIGYGNNEWISRFTHNHYLQIASELGLVGIILFLLFIFSSLLILKNKIKSKKFDLFLPGAVSAIIGFLVHIGMEFSWNFPGATIIFFWILGTAIGDSVDKENTLNIDYKFKNMVIGILICITIWHISFTKFYEIGIRYSNEGNLEKSNKIVGFCNKYYPINSFGHFVEGNNYIQIYNESKDEYMLEKGIHLMEKGLKLAPYDGQIHSHLGKLYITYGDLDNAQKHLELGAKYEPYKLNRYIDLANFFSSQKMYEDAEKTLLHSVFLKEYVIKNSSKENKKYKVFEASTVNALLFDIYKKTDNVDGMKTQSIELKGFLEEYPFLDEYYNMEMFDI